VSDPTIIVPERPDEADRTAILEALVAFNEKAGGRSAFQPLAILLQDPTNGKTVGGLWGRTVYDWLFVELFVVPEGYRGRNLGSQILTQAENIARQRGCIGVWLDTYTFQAPGFYKKQGYEVFGAVEDHPRGSSRTFLKKVF
jgi:GNAT superfamily N-acetyltransferase